MRGTLASDGSPTIPRNESLLAVWAMAAAFGTYFCMYAFRKPFTAATFEGTEVVGIAFKTLLVTVQVAGYMVSKFIGIKVISEMPPHRRPWAIIGLILCAEVALILFGLTPRPWNAFWLFVNGLPLGMVFGLVLGSLEGRRVTEALTAGLCASFILADGATKSVGSALLAHGVSEEWMPAVAGLVFLPLLSVCVAMLARVPAPSDEDREARTERIVLTRQERWALYHRYAVGFSLIVAMYLLITVLRSIRADFAREIWQGLGEAVAPSLFTYSEIYVALGVVVANGSLVCLTDNRRAFFSSLAVCGMGLSLAVMALLGLQFERLTPLTFMVLMGLGMYLPYVAVHTTVFERFLAMTRDRGTTGFLMYVADSIGYLGYVAVMLTRNLVQPSRLGASPERFLDFFVVVGWLVTLTSMLLLGLIWRYFAIRCPAARTEPLPVGVA